MWEQSPMSFIIAFWFIWELVPGSSRLHLTSSSSCDACPPAFLYIKLSYTSPDQWAQSCGDAFIAQAVLNPRQSWRHVWYFFFQANHSVLVTIPQEFILPAHFGHLSTSHCNWEVDFKVLQGSLSPMSRGRLATLWHTNSQSLPYVAVSFLLFFLSRLHVRRTAGIIGSTALFIVW